MSSESTPALVLASASPRRSELLASLGIAFRKQPANVDESERPGETPHEYVLRLARAKSRAIEAAAGELVLAADTIVVLDDRLLGKPRNRSEVVEMLEALSGRHHRVLTAVSLRDTKAQTEADDVAETRVLFHELTAHEIDWYSHTGEPDDKAGSYAMQGLGALFVSGIEGNGSNVIGLPIPLLYELFSRLGYDLKRLCGATKGA